MRFGTAYRSTCAKSQTRLDSAETATYCFSRYDDAIFPELSCDSLLNTSMLCNHHSVMLTISIQYTVDLLRSIKQHLTDNRLLCTFSNYKYVTWNNLSSFTIVVVISLRFFDIVDWGSAKGIRGVVCWWWQSDWSHGWHHHHLHHLLLRRNPEWFDILVAAYIGCSGTGSGRQTP